MHNEVPKEDSLLITILEQNWLHARHIEKRRLWFTNIFVLLLGGFFGVFFGGKSGIDPTLHRPMLVFLLILSFFGILFSIRCRMVFSDHTDKIEEIVESLDEPKYARFMGIRAKNRHLEFGGLKKIKYPKFLGVNWLFVYFYIIMTFGLVYFLFQCPLT